MLIEEALYSHLSGYAGLVTMLADRVYPLKMPEGCALPAVVYQTISVQRIINTDMVAARLQLSSWGWTVIESKQVAVQVRAAMKLFKGLIGGTGGVNVEISYFDNESDDESGGAYRTLTDFIVWYHE